MIILWCAVLCKYTKINDPKLAASIITLNAQINIILNFSSVKAKQRKLEPLITKFNMNWDFKVCSNEATVRKKANELLHKVKTPLSGCQLVSIYFELRRSRRDKIFFSSRKFLFLWIQWVQCEQSSVVMISFFGHFNALFVKYRLEYFL